MLRPQSFPSSILSVLLLLNLFHLFPSLVSAQGLSFDPCNTTTSCLGDRTCRTRTAPCQPGQTNCYCVPPEFKKCDGSFDCPDNERCIRDNVLGPLCHSCSSFISSPALQPVDLNAETCLGSTPYIDGHTGDVCGIPGTNACIPPRKCFFDDGTDFLPCQSHHSTCKCRDGDVTPCTIDRDCPYGERCVEDQNNSKLCLSCRHVKLTPVLTPVGKGDRCLLSDSTPSPKPAPPSSNRAPYRSGFSWDLCTLNPANVNDTVSATCPDSQKCSSARNKDNPLPCRKEDNDCFCSPPGDIRVCLISSHCPRGERCVHQPAETKANPTTRKGQTFCAGCSVSALFAKRGEWKLIDPDDNCESLRASPSPKMTPSKSMTPTPTPVTASSGNTSGTNIDDATGFPRGLTYDSCADGRSTICRGERLCREQDSDRACGPDDKNCQCHPKQLIKCSDDSVCPGGERCASASLAESKSAYCMACTFVTTDDITLDSGESCRRKPEPMKSESISPSPPLRPASTLPPNPSPPPSPSSPASSVCVAVHHLTEMSERQLVFGAHREAWVWCDTRGSCATGGHLVVWRGTAMRMQRYCESVGGCARKRMLVNSPRWRRGLRVRSGTEGLQFTALAARWETALEERMLATMIRMGA